MPSSDEGSHLGASVRSLALGDGPAFETFLAHVSDGDRRFLKEDLSDPGRAFAGFLTETNARRVVAVGPEGEVHGLAGAFRGEGWSSHVAELRVVVNDHHRQHGLGRALARAALLEGLKFGCTHAFVEVVAEQEGLVNMFQDLGFLPEALLPDFVRDGAGEFHDLMLLTHSALDVWAQSHVLGLDEMVSR